MGEGRWEEGDKGRKALKEMKLLERQDVKMIKFPSHKRMGSLVYVPHTSSLHACSVLVWCTQRLPRAFIVLENVSLSEERTLVLH